MDYTGIVIFLFTHQFVFSQKGEFYMPVEKSEVLIDSVNGSIRHKAVKLSRPIKFFGENVTKIWVRYFCPNSASSTFLILCYSDTSNPWGNLSGMRCGYLDAFFLVLVFSALVYAFLSLDIVLRLL